MRLNAAQHVSGVLTSKQSPNGQAGYQTLFYTRELLRDEEVRAIERQVQFSGAQDREAKWQSYRLGAQRHVISYIKRIPEPDEFGRRGRFFTHSLVFDASAAEQFDEVLLDFLWPQYFLMSLDEVLASGALKTGNIQAKWVEGKKEWVNEARDLLRAWSGEQLSQLYMLMSDPRRLIEQGQCVALAGSEREILDALKVGFLLTPANARKLCSFDTNASGDEPHSDVTFWARGFPAADAAGYVIDAQQRRVGVPESSSLRIDGFSLGQISVPLREAIVARMAQPPAHLLQCLLNHNYKAFVGEPIYQIRLSRTDLSLTAADLEMLTPLGRTHSGLGLLLALKAGNESHRLRMLADMGLTAYKQRIGELRSRPDFRPWQLFSPIFSPTWFELFRGEYSMTDLTQAVSVVAAYGSTQDREYLEEIREHLDAAEQWELGHWLKVSPHRLDRLQMALDKPPEKKVCATSGRRSNSLLRRFLHPFEK